MAELDVPKVISRDGAPCLGKAECRVITKSLQNVVWLTINMKVVPIGRPAAILVLGGDIHSAFCPCGLARLVGKVLTSKGTGRAGITPRAGSISNSHPAQPCVRQGSVGPATLFCFLSLVI